MLPLRATASASTPRPIRSAQSTVDYYLRDISSLPLVSREEECALADRIRTGDQDALNALVRGNLRFVVSIAKKYQNRGVPLPDLINEGNLGLVRAAQRFDASRGIRFISYAVWWVRQSILQALADQGHVIRMPLRSREAVRPATPNGPMIRVRRGLPAPRVLSLNTGAPGGDDANLADRLADVDGASPDAELLEQGMFALVRASLSTLKEREARVLRLYFGLDGGEPMTLAEVGSAVGVTRERARQIREAALQRLRSGTKGKALLSLRG